jgi:hypothetical protein
MMADGVYSHDRTPRAYRPRPPVGVVLAGRFPDRDERPDSPDVPSTTGNTGEDDASGGRWRERRRNEDPSRGGDR